MPELETRYNDDNTILLSVMPVATIRILASAKKIFGTGNSQYAFLGAKSTITSFTFEENPQLEEVCMYSFYDCSLLESADFSKCSKLSIIGDYAFSKCISMSTILLPESVKTIGTYCFSFAGLTSIYIPKNVQTLGERFIMGNKKLEEVTIDEDVVLTGTNAHFFANCNKLNRVTFQRKLNHINGDFFEGCVNLQYITIPDGCPNYVSIDNVIYNKALTSIFATAPKRTTDFVINKDVLHIEICGCIDLQCTRVIFNTKLITIGSYSFMNSLIAELNIPESVGVINNFAFSNCKNIETITFVSGLNKIGSSCFYDCTNLKLVILPDTLKTLGGGAFKNCHKDLEIKFNESSDFIIDDDYFITNRDSTKLSQYLGENETIRIADTIDTIQAMSFRESNVKELVFGEGSNLASIEYLAFFSCLKLETVNLPDTLTTIQYQAFAGCTRLKSVSFGPNLATLEYDAFKLCERLESVEFNRNAPLTVIEYRAFLNNKELLTVSLPIHIKTIEYEAFSYCTKLQKIDFPNSISTIEYDAFSHTGIKGIKFEPQPISDSAETLTEFSNQLFYDCKNLETIVFPTNLQKICFRALAYTNITKLEIPVTVRELGEYAFEGCAELTRFDIPLNSNLEIFNHGVFSKCYKFENITSKSSEFIVDQTALYNKEKTTFYILPPASPIKYFSFPATVTRINAGALLGCKNVKIIFLSERIETVGISAFEGCTSLKSINIPKNIKSIRENAFKDCTSLVCDLEIENKEQSYIDMLIAAKIPNKCLYPCEVKTCKGKFDQFSTLFSLFFLILE